MLSTYQISLFRIPLDRDQSMKLDHSEVLVRKSHHSLKEKALSQSAKVNKPKRFSSTGLHTFSQDIQCRCLPVSEQPQRKLEKRRFTQESTVRAFLKRLGSEFLEEFFMSEEEVLSLTFPRVYSLFWGVYRSRIWYLDITCINDLANQQ